MSSRTHGGRRLDGPIVCALAACLAVVSTGCGGASNVPPPAAPAPVVAAPQPAPTPAPTSASASTIGVFTLAQAARGKDVYAGTCKSCHTPADQTGSSFNQLWRGRPLSTLYTYVSTKMPQNDPGSLSPNDAADVVAYLLLINGLPVGAGELPPDADSLAHIVVGKPNTSRLTLH